MYKSFFGFNERPFNLVPNPVYLFLSRTHEEALAHLTYAVIQGEGFMEITGEVGTGKTTLCRAFLEKLDGDTNAAYIFNPNLNSVELLKAINDEFSIPSDADNAKDLIDTLNAFLIDQKAQGKNTVLIIDEAQNLTRDVLEQLRLLSNLETAKHKLLHIILVGQPELKEKLDSHELRQLRQRISLSCRLIPLTYKDVRNYIQHRIKIASEKEPVQFAEGAYRSIYNYSQGIPRLINIVCDRSLLTAFGLDQKEITQKIVKASIKELTDGNIKKNRFKKWKKAFLFFPILSLILFMIIYYHPGLFGIDPIFSSSKTKTVGSLYPINKKKPVPAITPSDTEKQMPTVIVSGEKKQIPTDTASKTKKPVPAVTAANTEKQMPTVIAPGEKKQDATETTSGAKKPVLYATTNNNKEPLPTVTVSEAKTIDPAAAESESKTPLPIVIASESKKNEVQKTKESKPVMEPTTKPVRNLKNLLVTMNRLSSRRIAIKVALNSWNIEPEIKPDHDTIDDDQNFFRLVSKKYHLLIRRINGNLNAVKHIDLPVILAVHLDKDAPNVYLTLIKLDTQKVTLRGGKQDTSIEVTPDELESYWSGVAYIPWKNFLSLTGTIPINSSKNSIKTLKMLLRDIGFKELEINPIYDDKTRQAVKKIQKKYGLHIDGTVGSTTKIALYNEKKGYKRPHIVNIAKPLVR